MTGLIDDNFKAELNRMEMNSADGELSNLYFVADKGAPSNPRIRIALDQAEKYNAQAVFFRIYPEDPNRTPQPQIYIYHDTNLAWDNNAYAQIHRRLWNAGIVPLVFILTPGQVKVLNCRQEPDFDKATNSPTYTPFRALEKLLAVDRAFAAREIASGTFWENPNFSKDFALENTAYYNLLKHLNFFRQELLKKKILTEPTVNRILVMAILVKYLNDRKDAAGKSVFPPGFLQTFSHGNNDSLDGLFRERGSCVRLFKYLSEHFNGGIFELNNAQEAELKQADLLPIALFLEGDEDPNGQGLFWPLYSFEDLPVELISNIYEEFLAEKNKGVVYTPPMLVDLLLDQCLPLKEDILSWKILDPACGSGVFLVGAFKRLIHCWRMANGWKKPTHVDLQNILKNNIFGFDEKGEAVLITAFSLCVALCEELEPLVIWEKLKFDNLRQRNLLVNDFFEIVESGEFDGNFDLIIGNPPFENKLTTPAAKRVEKASVNEQRPKLPYNQLALLFLEQSFRLAKNGATVCLIQPAGPLLYNGKAQSFRGYMFERFAIDKVFDFTPLEGMLFSKAQVAAAAIIGSNAPATVDKILHLTFRRTTAIKEKLLFELDPYDFHWISRKTVAKNQYAWKANLLGGGRLHRMLERLFTDVPSLGDYLKKKRKNSEWQFGEGFTEGSASKLNMLPNVVELTKVDPQLLRKDYKLKSVPQLAHWITGKPHVKVDSLREHGIIEQSFSPCGLHFFHRNCSSIKSIFQPPHVIIKKIVDGSYIPAVFSDDEMVFCKRFISIHAPRSDKDKLQKLANLLNGSYLYAILAAIVSSEMLVKRATALLKNDIMELPYPDDMHDLELSFWEQALVDDIGTYLIDFRRKGEKATVLTKTNDSDLRSFGEVYCNTLNPVYKDFRPLEPIQIGKGSFICYPFCYGDTPQIEVPKAESVIPFLDELLHRRHGSRLFINRILRIYEQNVIFMIKPNQKRYWLRSIALRDADETLVDLLGQGY